MRVQKRDSEIAERYFWVFGVLNGDNLVPGEDRILSPKIIFKVGSSGPSNWDLLVHSEPH